MASKSNRKKEEGFSLIEVMVAIVILTVGLLSLAQMMVVSTHSNTLSGRMTSCAALAKEQLERLKAAPFYIDVQNKVLNPILTPDDGDVDQPGGQSQIYDADGLPAANGLYEVRWAISEVATAMPLRMLRIQVRCLPAAGNQDQFAVIGDARFTTFRTSNN